VSTVLPDPLSLIAAATKDRGYVRRPTSFFRCRGDRLGCDFADISPEPRKRSLTLAVNMDTGFVRF